MLDGSRESPGDFSIGTALVMCGIGLREVREAEGCFTACIALWPDSHLAYFIVVCAESKCNNSTQRIATLTKCCDCARACPLP